MRAQSWIQLKSDRECKAKLINPWLRSWHDASYFKYFQIKNASKAEQSLKSITLMLEPQAWSRSKSVSKGQPCDTCTNVYSPWPTVHLPQTAVLWCTSLTVLLLRFPDDHIPNAANLLTLHPCHPLWEAPPNAASPEPGWCTHGSQHVPWFLTRSQDSR